MAYKNADVKKAAKSLREQFKKLDEKTSIRRAPELANLYKKLKESSPGSRVELGREVNLLKNEIEQWITETKQHLDKLSPVDVTAPMDINAGVPQLLPASSGSQHPISIEIDKIIEIYARMGFIAEPSREVDNDYYMFGSLNFPPEHPARDDYDTFVTQDGLIAPAHTSNMQNRVLKMYKSDLDAGRGIRVVIPGRVFRNEDVDASHEHTFYQLEGVYVDQGVNAGNLISTLKTFLEAYYGQELNVKTQPFYFPFTEPSFEFALSCPFCKSKGCKVCGHTGWIELLGCGMIHPNVLIEAGIDSKKYSGFAWGGGIDRLVMMKHQIEDIRHFHSANLGFLRQFG